MGRVLAKKMAEGALDIRKALDLRLFKEDGLPDGVESFVVCSIRPGSPVAHQFYPEQKTFWKQWASIAPKRSINLSWGSLSHFSIFGKTNVLFRMNKDGKITIKPEDITLDILDGLRPPTTNPNLPDGSFRLSDGPDGNINSIPDNVNPNDIEILEDAAGNVPLA